MAPPGPHARQTGRDLRKTYWLAILLVLLALAIPRALFPDAFVVTRAMLASKGERLVFPDHRKAEDGGKDKAARRISNWWFKEVPKDFTTTKPTRALKTTPEA